MNKKITASISILVFIFILFMVLLSPFALSIFDMSITHVLYNSVPSITPLIKIITTFGNTLNITLMVIFFAIILLLKKNYYSALFLIVDVSFISFLNHIIKQFIERPRPNVTHLVYAGGYSFPSGHSASSMALFVSLIFIISMLSNKPHIGINIILFLIPIIIGFTRIYLGVHYLSDVLAGWSYSLGLTILINSIFQKRKPNY